MEIPGKLLAVIVIGSAIIGGVIERGVSKPDTTESNKTVNEVIRYKVITKIIEHYNLDGSIDRNIVIDDGSVMEKTKEVSKVETKTTVRDWYAHGGTGVRLKDMERIYNLGIDRRILGPVWLGIYGTTQQEFGLRVGLQF